MRIAKFAGKLYHGDGVELGHAKTPLYTANR